MLYQFLTLHGALLLGFLTDGRSVEFKGTHPFDLKLWLWWLHRHYSHDFCDSMKIQNLMFSLLFIQTMMSDMWSPLFWISVSVIYLSAGVIVKGSGYSDCINFDEEAFPNRLYRSKRQLLKNGGMFLKFLDYQALPYVLIVAIIWPVGTELD